VSVSERAERVGWTTRAGLPAVVAQGPTPAKALCGYVGVPEGHPLFGLMRDDERLELRVHGGVTFADDHPGAGRLEPIIEEAWAALDGMHWWIGFDAGHGFDMQRDVLGGEISTRDMPYMRDQCEQLAAQLMEIKRA